MRFWDDVTELHKPCKPDRYCGSPLEAETRVARAHARRGARDVTLSALLLDLADPRWVIGHLPVRLLAPDETER